MINADTASRIVNFMPFIEEITFYVRTSGDTFSSTSSIRARRKKIDKKALGVEAEELNDAELIWQIAKCDFSTEPDVMDYLLDSAGVKWIIIMVKLQLNGNMYNLFCKKGV